jgi:hypothetical protein
LSMLRVPEQERRAHQAFLRAEEVLCASSGRARRRAEHKAKEATRRAEELKWRIEVGSIRLHSPPGSRPTRLALRKGSVDE